MSVNYKVIPFNRNALPRISDLVTIQTQMLPRSPVVKLGRTFMEKCYYDLLTHEGLIFGAVAYVDGKAAGFVCCTEDPNGFMRTALLRRWPTICWFVFCALISSPKRIAAIYEAWRVMAGRKKPNGGEGEREGELLTTAVMPEFRSRSFYKETRLRIGEDLMQCILKEMQQRGIRVVKTIIDADNGPSRAYVQGQGWVIDAEHVPGWKHPSVSYVWRAA